MLRTVLSLISVGLLSGVFFASNADAKSYKIDPAHTVVAFVVDHLGFSKALGRFNEVEGSLEHAGSWDGASVNITIQTASIDTAVSDRDDHLRSPDFFNAAEFPTMTFKSTAVESTGDNKANVTGDLTLLGVTKPVVLEVTFNKAGPHPDPRMAGVEVAGFSATTKIVRSEFGMTGFRPGIGDEIEIYLEVEGHNK